MDIVWFLIRKDNVHHNICPYWRSFPNFFRVCEILLLNGFKTVRSRVRSMGICEERQRQGPSHPIICLHRNSHHSNPDITLTLTAACFDFNFLLLLFLSRCFFSGCFAFFKVLLPRLHSRLFASCLKMHFCILASSCVAWRFGGWQLFPAVKKKKKKTHTHHFIIISKQLQGQKKETFLAINVLILNIPSSTWDWQQNQSTVLL